MGAQPALCPPGTHYRSGGRCVFCAAPTRAFVPREPSCHQCRDTRVQSLSWVGPASRDWVPEPCAVCQPVREEATR